LKKSFSKALLFIPCGVFCALNFLSAYYITSEGVYNGDFLGIPLEQSNFEVWVFACISSIPYFILYYIVLKIPPVNIEPLKLPRIIIIFTFIILTISLVLTLVFGVGFVGRDIYHVPSLVKPFFVIINRIDAVMISSILLLSPCVKWRSAVLIAILCLLITIFRGSLQFLPMLMLVLFYRVMIKKNSHYQSKGAKNYLIYVLFLILMVVTLYNVDYLYQYRDLMRGGSGDYSVKSAYELIFGQLIGRFSSVTALLMFYLRYEEFYRHIDELQYFSFIIDCFKYVWGGVVKTPVMNHYDFYTSIHDPDAYGFYAMQSGMIPTIGLSMMKSPIIAILDVIVTFMFIYFVVRNSTYFLGCNGKYLAMIFLVFAVLSGAPNQFSSPTFHLLIIMIVFAILKEFSSSLTQTKL